MTARHRSVLAATAAALLGLCAAPANAEKQLTVCVSSGPEGADIAQFTGGVTFDAIGETVFNRLFDTEIGTAHIVPSLVDHYVISPDGLTWTLSLRHGVKFQTTPWFTPTREFNADDVMFSLHRLYDPSHPWHKLARAGYPYFASTGLDKGLRSVDRVDDYTVNIVLSKPTATLPVNLTGGPFAIYSAEYAAKLLKEGKTDDMNSKPVGTGPFILQRYDKDAAVRLTAHPGYFQGRAKLDRLILAVTHDPAVRAQRVKAGECQVALEIKTTDLPDLRNTPGIQIDTTIALLTDWVALNVTHKPLDDKRVRQALNYAIDKPALIKAMFGEGNAAVASTMYPSQLWAFPDTIKDYPYDPVRARKLLAEAGVGQGFDLTLISRTSGNVAYPNPRVAAELIQSDFKAIGVNVKIVPLDFGEMLARTQRGEHDIALQAWSGQADPDSFMTLSTCDGANGGFNVTRWCDPAYDKLVEGGRRITDQAERTKLYIEAQKYFKDAAVWIPLAHPLEFVAHRKNVTGPFSSPTLTHNFYLADVK